MTLTRAIRILGLTVSVGLLSVDRAESSPVNREAAQKILDSAIDFACGGFDVGNVNETELMEMVASGGFAGGCGVPADYWKPYYVVELVPGSFESVFLPEMSGPLNETLGSIQSTVMETLLNGINAGNEGKRVTFSKRAGGSFGNVHYYETHVYRLDFDPLEAFKSALKASLGGKKFKFTNNLIHPSVCYFSEIDPFGWRLGVPSRECKWRREEWCECWYDTGIFGGSSQRCKCSEPGANKKHSDTCESVEVRPQDKYRFWEGIRKPSDGFFSWGNLNDRSGWIGGADGKFAQAGLSLRASSLGATRPPLWEGSDGGCWYEGRGTGEFNPLSAEVLSNDEVLVQLVYDSDGYGWDKCIAPGWEAKEWKRDEYWKGRVNNGAIYVVYKKASGCFLDADLVQALAKSAAKNMVISALTGGVDIIKKLYDVYKVGEALNDIKNSIEDFIKALEEIPRKVEQAKDTMKMIFENIGGGFGALGALLVTGDADVAAGVAQMQLNAVQTGIDMQREATEQVAEASQRLVSLRTEAIGATGERKRELEEQARELESLKGQLEDRAKELVNDLRKQAEQQAKQMAAQGIQLGIGGLFKLLEIPVEVAYSVECAADSAWETYEGVMKLATFEACGVGIGDASKKAGNVIAKMEGFRRDGQKIAKYAKPLFEPACMQGMAHDGVRNIHNRVCSPAGPLCPASESFHVKADKFLGYGKYADMACQVIDLVMSPPKEPSGWLLGVMGTVVPNLGDLGGSLDGLEALSDLPDPAPLLSAATRIQSASALTQLERQKAAQDLNGLIAGIKGLPANSVKDARRKMQRLAGGEFLKDWAEDVKNDAKAALDSIPKPKFKWADVKRVASQAGAMARDVKRLTKLATDFDPGDPPKMTEAAIGTITIVAMIPERIDMMATEGKGLAKKASDYATDLGNFVGGSQFGDPFRKLSGRISKLDDDLVAEIETALTPLDGKAIKDLALDFRDLEKDAARWSTLGVPEAASLQSFAGQTAAILERASSVRIPTGDLRKALKPVSDKLDQVASFINELARPDKDGPLVQIAGMLKSVGEGFNKMASWADSQRGCKDPQDVNGCVNALFSNPDAKAMNEKGESVLPVGQLIASLGAYAKMQAAGSDTARWVESRHEIAGEGKSDNASLRGRFVGKVVPLRQEEIDEGKDAAWLEEKAKQEHEKLKADLKALGPGGATPLPTTKSERQNPESPVYKLDRKAIEACKNKARQKGWEESMCDRKW